MISLFSIKDIARNGWHIPDCCVSEATGPIWAHLMLGQGQEKEGWPWPRHTQAAQTMNRLGWKGVIITIHDPVCSTPGSFYPVHTKLIKNCCKDSKNKADCISPSCAMPGLAGGVYPVLCVSLCLMSGNFPPGPAWCGPPAQPGSRLIVINISWAPWA